MNQIVETHFELRPGAIMRDLGLRRPIYYQTASYGNFGRADIELPWEQTNLHRQQQQQLRVQNIFKVKLFQERRPLLGGF